MAAYSKLWGSLAGYLGGLLVAWAASVGWELEPGVATDAITALGLAAGTYFAPANR